MPVQGIPTALDWIDHLEQRKRKLTDPADVAKIDVLVEHLMAEFTHDWDATMATMLDAGVSRAWGGGAFLKALEVDGTNVMPNSVRRGFYEGVTEAGGDSAFRFLALETERLFVGEDGVVCDGVLWNIVPGEQLDQWGAELPAGGSPDKIYAVGRRLALFLSFQDGKIVGEDTYWDQNYEVRELDGPPPIPTVQDAATRGGAR
ncbi:MAG TPA: hypothetical protein VGH89_03805 [Pseudonocardia sp.]|jgi:hypothetical protein